MPSGLAAYNRSGRVRPAARIIRSLNLVDEQGPPPRRGALIGLIVAAVLAVAAVYLIHALREESQREDCLMSGRSNCAPIETPGTSR
jgi:hypothetical protein